MADTGHLRIYDGESEDRYSSYADHRSGSLHFFFFPRERGVIGVDAPRALDTHG